MVKAQSYHNLMAQAFPLLDAIRIHFGLECQIEVDIKYLISIKVVNKFLNTL